MFLRYLLGILLLLLCVQVFGQGKEIVGDTASWYRWGQPFIQELGLTNYEETEETFAFRFSWPGFMIEIKGTEGRLAGNVFSYVFWKKRAYKYGNEEAIHLTTELPKEKVDSIYGLIQELKILELPTDRDIPGWSRGLDGITYVMEFANQSTYTFNYYWTPSAQDSLEAANKMLVFIERISAISDIKGNWDALNEKIPRHGCYHVKDELITCTVSHLSSLGYQGATQLPFGGAASTGLPYLGKKYFGLNVSGQYQKDAKGNYGYSYSISKNKIFFGNTWSGKDGISYQFRQKRLAFVAEDTKLINQQLLYGFSLNSNTSIAGGIDSFKGGETELGLRLRLSHRLFNQLWIGSLASFFEGRVDYEIHASTGISWTTPMFVRSINIGFFYEQYFDYRDANLSVRANF